MKCVKCKSETTVKDSRPHQETIRRRRICKKCNHKFFTLEILEEPPKVLTLDSGKLKIEKPPKKKKEPDFDNMTDEEIEAYFYE